MIFRISPVRSIALFGEVKTMLTPDEARLYEASRRGGKHCFGSRPFDYHRNGKTKLRVRKTRWHGLQQTLQHTAKQNKI